MILRIPESIFSGHGRLLADVRDEVINGNTDILAENISPTNQPLSFFILYCSFENAGSLVVRRTFTDKGTTKSEVMNEGYTFADSAAYTFGFPVSRDEEINFQYSQNTTAIKLTVIETQVL